MEGGIEPAPTALIEALWRESWGIPVVTPQREYRPEDMEGAVWRSGDGQVQGLVTWAIEGGRAEIVSLEAMEPGRRVGSRLMDAAEAELRRRGVSTVCVATTNDNPRALAFYVRRGYRLVRLHLNAMDRVRAVKPDVSAVGNDGIPLLDMWELEKGL